MAWHGTLCRRDETVTAAQVEKQKKRPLLYNITRHVAPKLMDRSTPTMHILAQATGTREMEHAERRQNHLALHKAANGVSCVLDKVKNTQNAKPQQPQPRLQRLACFRVPIVRGRRHHVSHPKNGQDRMVLPRRRLLPHQKKQNTAIPKEAPRNKHRVRGVQRVTRHDSPGDTTGKHHPESREFSREEVGA